MLKIIMPTYLLMWVNKKRRYALNLNTYRNLHFQVNNNLKKKYKELIREQVKEFATSGQIEIKAIYYNWTKRKSDLENNCIVHIKYLLDALVEEHRIKTDDYDTVKRIEFIYWWYEKDNGRVEIYIK
jgi:Holliday junction resolvase RusA-like endonuclease